MLRTDSRSKDTTTNALTHQVFQLGRTIQHMSYLLPVDQVPTMEDRDTRKIAARRGNQKIISFPIGADARIGIPPGQDRIIKVISSRQRILTEVIIFSFINKRVKMSLRIAKKGTAHRHDEQ